MLEPKSQLVDAHEMRTYSYLWALANSSADEISTSTNVQYVLDGGSLLNHIPRVKGLTFGRLFLSVCRSCL